MDPDRLIRDTLNTVPVPPDLENRIRASLARRRQLRYGALAAAAAILITVAALWMPTTPKRPPPATPVAFSVSLAPPTPEPLPLQEIQFTAEVDAESDTLVFHLTNGGTHDD